LELDPARVYEVAIEKKIDGSTSTSTVPGLGKSWSLHVHGTNSSSEWWIQMSIKPTCVDTATLALYGICSSSQIASAHIYD